MGLWYTCADPNKISRGSPRTPSRSAHGIDNTLYVSHCRQFSDILLSIFLFTETRIIKVHSIFSTWQLIAPTPPTANCTLKLKNKIILFISLNDIKIFCLHTKFIAFKCLCYLSIQTILHVNEKSGNNLLILLLSIFCLEKAGTVVICLEMASSNVDYYERQKELQDIIHEQLEFICILTKFDNLCFRIYMGSLILPLAS